MTTEEKIKEVLANHVSPALQSHGGDCSFVKYDEPIATLYVAMEGACGSCPFALETLRMTVEQAVIAEVPEVKAVERV
ncbi:MAG: NifU family protein [Synergistaceae bacterium]|nr:NifU family protein [Synergistaceae bacterium]